MGMMIMIDRCQPEVLFSNNQPTPMTLRSRSRQQTFMSVFYIKEFNSTCDYLVYICYADKGLRLIQQ